METGDSEGLFYDFLFRLCRKHHNGFSREFPEKTQCTDSMSRSVWLAFIALCADVSFCLPLNQAFLCKGYLCKWKCCCYKEHRQAVTQCIEFLAGINPRPWCFVQRVPSLWVRNMMESRDKVCHQKDFTQFGVSITRHAQKGIFTSISIFVLWIAVNTLNN